MALKFLKFIFLAVIVAFTVFFVSIVFKQIPNQKSNNFHDDVIQNQNLNSNSKILQKISTTTENIVQLAAPKPKPVSSTLPPIKSKTTEIITVKEVSSKSFEDLINSSVIQLYCGNLSSDGMSFSDISRGTGIIIDDSGRLLTNRHVIYDENLKKIKNSCFVLKSPFPNSDSQKPKIYYKADVINYPLLEKFSEFFSEDKYYNDFSVLKISSKINKESKINLLLGFDYASLDDYSVIENNGLPAQAGPPGGLPTGKAGEASRFNFLPIDWDYQPKNDDFLITLGYGVDASHLANKITSTIGKITGNININKSEEPQILLIESNATTGFSGGALINPKSKGLIGLVSWITAGDITGKYTVAIFRDFLRNMMLTDLNFDLKLTQTQ